MLLIKIRKSSLKIFSFVDDHQIHLKKRVILVEREMILEELKRNCGNKSKTAKEMGISREALRKKMMLSSKVLDEIEVLKSKKKAA